jgi:hypothetical protein
VGTIPSKVRADRITDSQANTRPFNDAKTATIYNAATKKEARFVGR